MAFKNPFKEFSTGKLFVFVVALLGITQVLSLLISMMFSKVPVLKTGSLLIILAAVLGLIFLTKIVFEKESKDKINVLWFIIIVAVTVGMYYYGGKIFPQMFSILGDSALQSAQSLASSIGLP